MENAQTATVIAYDSDNGKELFSYHDTLVRDRDRILVGPMPNQVITHNDRRYHVVRVREYSAESTWGIDVREETP